MKNRFIILSALLLLLIPGLAAQTATDRLDIIQQQVEALRSELATDTIPVTNIRAEMISPDRIEITWSSDHNLQADIQYYDPERNREWQHSVARYRGPVELAEGRTEIGVGTNTTWLLRFVVEEWVSDVYLAAPFVSGVTPPPDEIRTILWGYWDGHVAPPENQNVFKLPWNMLRPGEKLIPMIGGFNADDTESQIRRRLRDRAPPLNAHREDIQFIILHDEPFYKGFTPEHQEVIIRAAKEEIGDHFQYAFSYARGALRDQPDRDRRIPSNLDIAVVNTYIFYYEEWWPAMYITDYAAFQRDMDATLKVLTDAGVNQVVINGQSIYDEQGKYRRPEPKHIEWYFNYAQSRPEIIGQLWFEWRNRNHWRGAESMPDLVQEKKRLLESMQ